MLVRIGNFMGHIADSRTGTLLGVAAVIVTFGCFGYFADAAMLRFDVPSELHAAAQATFVGVAAGSAALVLLMALRERRKLIRDEMLRIGELNHRLRNSLELIADAHHLATDEQHKRMMMEAVQSMDDTLRQVFPVLGFELRTQVPKQRFHVCL